MKMFPEKMGRRVHFSTVGKSKQEHRGVDPNQSVEQCLVKMK